MPANSRVLTLVVTAALAATLGSPCPSAAQQRPAQNVLTIHSGAVDSATNPVIDAGIRQALLRPGKAIDYFTEYLEFDRFPEVETSRALGDYIDRKYAGRRIDLVIAITNYSLRFVAENRQRLFKDAAVVFAALGGTETLLLDGGEQVTGVTIGNNYVASLELALKLHPKTRQVFVVASAPNQENVASVRAALAPFSNRVTLTYLEPETLSGLREAVRAIPQGSLILYLWYQRPGPQYIRDTVEPARLVTSAATVPVYGVSDWIIGTGVVGGVLRNSRAMGVRVGDMARQVLDGTPAANIPIEPSPLMPIFDWRQLRRWGVAASVLPPGAEIRFRTPTAWESYRLYILAALLVMAIQLLLIAALLAQRASRQRVERTLRTREATLRTSYVRIRQLAGRLISAQETARADIARDLHDDICQELVGVSMTVSTLKQSSGSVRDPRTQQVLAALERSAQNAVDGVRRLSHELHPASLRLLGLASALKGHCLEVQKRHGVHVSFAGPSTGAALPLDVAVCLFRIAQEALRNGIVHGAAQRLTVSLITTASHVDLSVADDGRGFDLEAVRRDGGGLGLVSIEERAHVVGGTVQIVSGVSRGTAVHVRVPIEQRERAEAAEVPRAEAPSIMRQLNRALGVLKQERRRAKRLVQQSRRFLRPPRRSRDTGYADGTSFHATTRKAVAIVKRPRGQL